MKSKIDRLFEKIGYELNYQDVMTVIYKDTIRNKYQKFLMEVVEDGTKDTRTAVKEFLNENINFVDIDGLILVTLYNQINNLKSIDKLNLQVNERELIKFNCIEKVYNCKELLDGKKVRVYPCSVDTKNNICIVEKISSEEMCAVPVAQMYGLEDKENKVFQNRVEKDKKRKSIYELQKSKEKKIKTENTIKLAEFFEKYGSDEIFEYFDFNDITTGLIDESNLAGRACVLAFRNSIFLQLKKEGKEFDEEDYWNTDKYANVKIDSDTKKKIIVDIINANMEDINVDKFLLTIGGRSLTALEEDITTCDEKEMSEDEKNKIIQTYTLLKDIYDILGKDNKNKCIIRNLKDDTRYFDFSAEILKNILEYEFDGKEMYFSQNAIEKAKEELKKGDKTLKDFSKKILDFLEFTFDEFIEIYSQNQDNFEEFLNLIEDEDIEDNRRDFNLILNKIEKIDGKSLEKIIKKNYCSGLQLIELCTEGKINLKQLLDINEKENSSNIEEVIIFSFEKLLDSEVDEEKLYKKELLELFNEEKIEEYLKENKIDERFIRFYSEILPSSEEERNETLSKTKNIFGKIEDKDLVLNLYSYSIFEAEDLKGKISEYEAIEFAEKDLEIAIDFKNADIIDLDSMQLILEETEFEYFIQMLDNKKLQLEDAVFNIPNEKIDIYKKYNEEKKFNSPNPALWGYITNNLSIEELEKLYKTGEVTEDFLYEVAQEGLLTPDKIRQIYLNTLISEEKIDLLVEQKVITQSFALKTKNSLNMQNIADGLTITGLGIIMDGTEIIIDDNDDYIEEVEMIELPEGKNGSGGGSGNKEPKMPKLKTVIDPMARKMKIESYGAQRIARGQVEYDEQNPFNDYEFYILPKETGEITPDCLVIAERYYKDKFSDEHKLIKGNATYLFKLKDLTRIARKSKTEIIKQMQEATDKSMDKASHSKRWAKNLDEKVFRLLDKKMESTYTKEELEKIHKLNGLIDGFINKDNEVKRIFDVSFY